LAKQVACDLLEAGRGRRLRSAPFLSIAPWRRSSGGTRERAPRLPRRSCRGAHESLGATLVPCAVAQGVANRASARGPRGSLSPEEVEGERRSVLGEKDDALLVLRVTGAVELDCPDGERRAPGQRGA